MDIIENNNYCFIIQYGKHPLYIGTNYEYMKNIVIVHNKYTDIFHKAYLSVVSLNGGYITYKEYHKYETFIEIDIKQDLKKQLQENNINIEDIYINNNIYSFILNPFEMEYFYDKDCNILDHPFRDYDEEKKIFDFVDNSQGHVICSAKNIKEAMKKIKIPENTEYAKYKKYEHNYDVWVEVTKCEKTNVLFIETKNGGEFIKMDKELYEFPYIF
uniref:Uncharacterized protein n=1 Tax=Pithovirus LCDPAC02 TaxID=2506601 RepID=A0A481YQ09_9VIRU|nr:MAG: hypothetical protein LCDPAC02_02060 [Pithovirus LCDPAC02]